MRDGERGRERGWGQIESEGWGEGEGERVGRDRE